MEPKQDDDTSENRANSKKSTKDKLNIEHYSPKKRIYSDEINSMDEGTMEEPKEHVFKKDNPRTSCENMENPLYIDAQSECMSSTELLHDFNSNRKKCERKLVESINPLEEGNDNCLTTSESSDKLAKNYKLIMDRSKKINSERLKLLEISNKEFHERKVIFDENVLEYIKDCIEKDKDVLKSSPENKISKYLYKYIIDIDRYLEEFRPHMDSEKVKKFKAKFHTNYKNVWETEVSKVCDKELLQYIKACNDDFNDLRYKINRDAHAYSPAINVVTIPKNLKLNETNEVSRRKYYSNIQEVEEATSSDASTSRDITVRADQAGKKLEVLSDEESIRSTKFTPLCLSHIDRNNSETEDRGEKYVERDTSSRNAPSSDSSTTTQSATRPDSTVANKDTSESPPKPTKQNNDRKLKNRRPLSLEATTYELEKFSKNVMLVINQEEVEGYPELRIGTEDDVTALKQTFGNFGFEVEEHTDKTIIEVFNILKEFSERDFTDYGCIAVAILTHGTRYGLLRAKDLNQMYSELSVLDYFKASNNPTLLTKPIILIIQACRGDDNSIGFPVNAELKIRKDLDGDVEPYYLPLHADTLVLHSSFYGQPSFRPGNGSWFIQTLCEKINLLSPTYDLMSIITEVQRDVAIKKVSIEYSLKTKEMEVNKQMPVMTSTLIRKLYLIKGEDEHWQTKSTLTSCGTIEAGLCLNNIEHDLVGVPCSCFVAHFNYLKNCLSHFVDENPIDRKDPTARHLLKDANTLNENYDLPKAKTTLIAISNFLENKSRRYTYHKYLHFYRVHDMDLNTGGGNLTIWRMLSQNYVLIGVACIMLSTFILRQLEECILRV